MKVTRGMTCDDTGVVPPRPSPDDSVSRTIEVVVRRNVGIHAGEGTRLAADLYFPARAGTELKGPFPVVLERTPYGRARQTTVELASRLARERHVFVSQEPVEPADPARSPVGCPFHPRCGAGPAQMSARGICRADLPMLLARWPEGADGLTRATACHFPPVESAVGVMSSSAETDRST